MAAVRDYEFYGVLNNIATSLKKIGEVLSSINDSKKRETEQYLRESRQRMRGERLTLLKESRVKTSDNRTSRVLGESKGTGKTEVNTGKQ